MHNIVQYLFVVAAVTSVSAACPQIVTRDEWGARPPVAIQYSMKPVLYVVIQHTATPECVTERDCIRRIYNMQSYHMDEQEFDDIAYNFLIGSDGRVYQGVGWHKIGSHTRGYNSNSIGIGFIGTFDNKLPPAAALNAAKNLIECSVALGELDRNYRLIGARQVRDTTSPGLRLYREIKMWSRWTASP